MKRDCFIWLSGLMLACSCFLMGSSQVWAAVSSPELKWQHDCSNWECSDGWYSSPAVADLDGDGAMEVIGAMYHLYILRGADGGKILKTPLDGRCWPGVAVADLDGDGNLDIVTGDNGSYVHVFDRNGQDVWKVQPWTTGGEIRGLALYDLDGDGSLEILANRARSGKLNSYILEHDGSLRSGWPQLADDSGYAAGVFNDSAAVADLDGDGRIEIVVPSDVHYICAYKVTGEQLPANAMYPKGTWGLTGLWESLDTELRGWGECDGVRQESYRTNMASGVATIADVNGDGSNEVVVTGNVYDCSVGDTEAGARYTGVYVLNPDRSRFNLGGNDWQTPPVDTGNILTNDYGVIENNQPNAVTADLDGDGNLEILFPSYDGRMHAFWLDKTEHGNWPFSVYDSGEGFFRFATEPVVADLDNDGKAEVIFADWTQKGSNQTGRLHVVDYQGNLLFQVTLPGVPSGETWNGALAAPTLANIDGDDDLEVVLLTKYTGLVAYDLPGSAGARVLWATGRNNFQRNGAAGTQGGSDDPPDDGGGEESGDTGGSGSGGGGGGGCFLRIFSH